MSATIVRIIKIFFTGMWLRWRKILEDVEEAKRKKIGVTTNCVVYFLSS